MDYKHEIKKGEALFADGQIDQAQVAFEFVLQNQPASHEALNNLGVIHHANGNVQAAEDFFLKALSVKKNYPDALLNLGDLYQNTKRWEEAALQLEKYIAIDNQDPNLFNQLGVIYLEMGNIEKARIALIKSLELNPNQETVRDSLKALEGKREAPRIEVTERPLNILFVQEAPCIRNYKMATALRSRGHKVSLAYTKAKLSQMYKGLSDDVYDENIHIANFRQLWDISKNYDIVHCHNEPDILTVAALAGDAPVIHDTHDLISLRANGDANLSYFEGVANRGAAGRVYSTQYQMEEAKRLYGVESSSLIFYNYASESDLPARFLPKLSDQDGNVHIVYEGGIGGNTHRDFSSLFVDLAKKGIHIHIYPTFFNQEIAAFFSEFPTIRYYQPLSPKQIMEEMTQYDFGIIPFNLEKGNKRFLDSTIANKLFEYLAAGLPVITSPLKTYINYFRQNPVGITFNTPEDVIDNLSKLEQIAKTTDFSRQVFTYEREVQKLEAFYEKILNSNGNQLTEPDIREQTSDFIKNAYDRLISWIDNNGWDGYDPYDIQDYFIQKAKQGVPVSPDKQQEILQKGNVYPVKVCEELGIKKKRNAKALGLLTSARMRLYKVTNERHHLDEAERLADWLLNNSSKGYENLCWGYPFDWQSVIFIPKGTPSAVVSTVVGDGFWELYTVTRKNKYLEACNSIGRFINENLKMDDMGEKGVCFSYTPIDDYHVHNANLFCGEFLARIGKEVENEEWLELAERTADYAISEQNKDGSIFYWGRIQNQYAPNKLDHYHSGFEIRCLFKLAQHLQLDKIRSAYEKYLNFYLQNFFLPDGTPKITPQKPYPVNIHGAAESILALSMLSKEHGELFEMARRSLSWTINHMQMSEGWFGYLWALQGRVDAPFLRWGQAWMLRAFAEYFVAEKILSREWGYYSKLTNTPGRKATITSSARRDQELEELKDLAFSYAKLDKGKIPLHVIKAMADKIDGDLHLEEKQKTVLESIGDPNKWQQLIDLTTTPKVQAHSVERKSPSFDCQIMMPDTGQLLYGSKEWAEALFKNSVTDPWGHDWRASQKARYMAALELLKKHISPNSIQNILDIGCALGHFTAKLREYFTESEVMGVDISDEAILKSCRKYSNIRFEVASLPILNVSKIGFDFVSALEVIYYVGADSIDQSLQRIHDIMTDGGYLLISTYLNKPPFVTNDNFKKSISEYFQIVDESILYHGLYSHYETMIRQSIDAFKKLPTTVGPLSSSVVDDFAQAGIKILADMNLINQINNYTREHIREEGISHSIILAVKK